MIIEYIHCSNPNQIKTHDTKKILKNRRNLIKRTQEDYDKIELENFKKDKENGVVLYYKVIAG